MEEENNRSFEACQEKVNENTKPSKEGEEEIRDEKVEKSVEQRRVSSDSSSDCAVGNSSTGESKASQSKTLASVKLYEGDFPADFDESSHHLSGSSTVPFSLSLSLDFRF